MQVFAVFAVIVITLVTESCQKQEFSDVINKYQASANPFEAECVKEANADPDLTKKLLTGNFPDNAALKCYTKCMFVKTGIMTSNGEVVNDVLKTHTGISDETIAGKIFHKCKDTRGANECETAYEIAKCIFRGAQEAVKSS